MLKFITVFFISFLINFIKVKTKPSFSLDNITGVQKFHSDTVPRLGGLGVFLGFLFFSIYEFLQIREIFYLYLLISSLPVFIGGILEDITKKVSPKKRLIFASISAFLSIALFKVYIYKLDIIFIDSLLKFLPFAFIFTVFAITGVSNAYNIIDGFNGLASSIAIIVFTSFAYIGFIKNDDFILNISLAMVFAILGFFIWNYPFGKIFLGDGGAYFIGFIIGFLSVYLVFKHRDISPWYPMLLSTYPIFETVYSMYRRKFIKKLSPTEPDAFHLHTLIYKRLIPKLFPKTKRNRLLRNSLVAPFLIVLYIPFVVIANLYWNNSKILIFFSFIYILIYLFLYKSIIKFKIKFIKL